jgi:Na+-translocating ferredoxin:NAD+ oxidoreductase RnfA subunit
MGKKKKDSSIEYVEPGTTFIIGVKEGEWKELKQYRDEGIFFQLGTSFIAFAATVLLDLITIQIKSHRLEIILWVAFGVFLGAGALLIFLWLREKKQKDNVVKRVEGRAKEQYGDNIDL